MSAEVPVCFRVAGETRIGIIHVPAQPADLGVLVIVGGWQYRVGGHRQFVLLARALSEAGIAVMRFDSRGMGDSDGVPGVPEPAEHLASDIRAALNEFSRGAEGISKFVLCGLCDGASAALIYGPTDARVRGLILLNPWVSSPQSAARAVLANYYWQHLREGDLWRKIVAGNFDIRRSARDLISNFQVAGGRKPNVPAGAAPDAAAEAGERIDYAMAQALDVFTGRVLLVLSGRDRTAAQYSDVVARSPRWHSLLRAGRATRLAMPGADHTFSRRELRDALARQMVAWLQSS